LRQMPVDHAALALAFVEKQWKRRRKRALGSRRHQIGQAGVADGRADTLDVFVLECGRRIHGLSPLMGQRWSARRERLEQGYLSVVNSGLLVASGARRPISPWMSPKTHRSDRKSTRLNSSHRT